MKTNLLTLAMLSLMALQLHSQNKSKPLPEEVGKDQVTVRIQIFTNDKKSDRNDFEIDVINLATNSHNRDKIENSITILLQFNKTFRIIVGHKDFNYKTIEIDTHAPVKRWVLDIDLYLYSGEPNSSAGKLQYSEQAKNFVKIE
jgi:hypothetical protein